MLNRANDRLQSVRKEADFAALERVIEQRREAGELGFEPRLTESESVVLPLHHSPEFQRSFLCGYGTRGREMGQ